MKAHPLTPEHARYGQFNELEEINQKRIRTLIEDLAQKPAASGSLAQKIGSLYRLSMDSVRRNREGYEPIRSTTKLPIFCSPIIWSAAAFRA